MVPLILGNSHINYKGAIGIMLLDLFNGQLSGMLNKCNGKENGNYYRGYIGIMGFILGLYWDNGKENGDFYRDYMNFARTLW